MEVKRFFRKFGIAAAVLLLLCMAAVLFFDPFFHYHAAIRPLKNVATKKEYQVIGTLRNFDYDSVIVGSSTAENYNNHWFDDNFECRSVKIIKSSGTTKQLDYFVNEAFANREIRNVFYSLDLFALMGEVDIEFPDESFPLYLYDKNPFNDVKYFWNKDVLFEDIPYMIASSFLDDYDEGTSYNWAQYKTFSEEEARKNYVKPEGPEEIDPKINELIDANIDLLEEQVKKHPETDFRFFYPPYSCLWWENMTITGYVDWDFYALQASMERLMGYDNVELYFFQNDEDIIMNLNLYMDPVHFSADINHYMVDEMAVGNYRITEQNYNEQLESMRILAARIAQ